MKIQSVRGTRDYYPETMRLRNWIVDAWKRVSLRNGFEEYDSPIFEYLDLFTAKSGPEIASQLFHFTDRGGRNLAIRPEITPSLARMVNAKIQTLPRPIKWFSVPRLCRAERPQKGRLREFFQWNVDIIGSDDVLADAECILVAADLLRELNLTPEDVNIRIGSRPLTIAAINAAGVDDQNTDKILAILDKRPKLPQDTFEKLCLDAGLSGDQLKKLCLFQDCPTVDDLPAIFTDFNVEASPAVTSAIDDLRNLMNHLKAMGISQYCKLDLRIVRGLAYYTGIVYEIFDGDDSLRALAGGGRYDNLLQVLGGPQVGAAGFGMGDVILGILLDEKNKIPTTTQRLDFFVIDDDEDCLEPTLEIVSSLRKMGWRTDFSLARQKTPKQITQAVKKGARAGLFITRDQTNLSPDSFSIRLKDFDTQQQYPTAFFISELLERPELTTAPNIDHLLQSFGFGKQ